MTKIITIAGPKGGTGKSVTAVNIAISLAILGKNTLLIDCDPQGSSTQWCGLEDLDDSYDIASVLSGSVKITDAVMKTQVNCLNIIPAGFNLFRLSLTLAKKTENEKILRLLLKEVEDAYEYIIIDSPSSYGFLSIAAMTAADRLLVCMSVHHNSLEDVHCFLQVVKYIQTTHAVPLKIAGCLFNRCETKEEIFSFLECQNLSDIKQMVYHTIIPEDENIKKSIALKIPIALHDIKSPAAAAYLNFAEEIHFSLI